LTIPRRRRKLPLYFRPLFQSNGPDDWDKFLSQGANNKKKASALTAIKENCDGEGDRGIQRFPCPDLKDSFACRPSLTVISRHLPEQTRGQAFSALGSGFQEGGMACLAAACDA
jgi:hypothetical protein